MSAATEAGVVVLSLGVCAGVAGIAYHSLRMSRRRTALDKVAEEFGFQPWNGSIPEDLGLAETTLMPFRSTFSAFHGSVAGSPAAFFDCSVRHGRSTRYFSVVAAKAAKGAFAAAAFDRELKTDRPLDWLLLYRDSGESIYGGLFSVEEIREHLRGLGIRGDRI